MVELKQGYQGGPHPVRLVSFQEVAVRMQTASCVQGRGRAQNLPLRPEDTRLLAPHMDVSPRTVRGDHRGSCRLWRL